MIDLAHAITASGSAEKSFHFRQQYPTGWRTVLQKIWHDVPARFFATQPDKASSTARRKRRLLAAAADAQALYSRNGRTVWLSVRGIAKRTHFWTIPTCQLCISGDG